MHAPISADSENAVLVICGWGRIFIVSFDE
jgi:hypothetical protein